MVGQSHPPLSHARLWHLSGQKTTKGNGKEVSNQASSKALGWWAGWEDRGQGQRQENKGV